MGSDSASRQGKSTVCSDLTAPARPLRSRRSPEFWRATGEIIIHGIDIDSGPAARALIGIVPQAITLYLDLTARENLDFWGRMYDLSGAPLRGAIDRALDAVGLTNRADDIVGT
jgi:ABC-2 type transport system ATP-binding protein